jgi:hypothetical protein
LEIGGKDMGDLDSRETGGKTRSLKDSMSGQRRVSDSSIDTCDIVNGLTVTNKEKSHPVRDG